MADDKNPKDSDAELENIQRMNAYLGCRGTHRNAQGRLMPCSSEESLNRVSDRAEPNKKVRKRRRRNDEFEKLRPRGVRGIDTLPGGGLVSAPIVVKAADDSPRMKRRKARSDREAATPAPLKDRVVGSSRNPKGTASSTSSGSNIELDDAVDLALRNKVKQHNEKMRSAGKPDHAMASLRALKAVYRRGAGAFSVSHRPGKSRGQWAMARVNAFLFLLDKSKPRNVRYVTDNDLLPSSHPRSTGKKKVVNFAVEQKSLGKRIGKKLRRVAFDPNAEDRDGDGLVQEGSIHERPAAPSGVPQVQSPRLRRRRTNETVVSSGNNLNLFNKPKTKPGVKPQQVTAVADDGLPKGRTSGRALKNRFSQIEKEVEDQFGPINTRAEAVAALSQAFPFADLDDLLLSDNLTNAERGGVTALLSFSQNYPKTAESIDSMRTQLDLGKSGRFSVRTGFSDDGSTLAINNNVTFGRTFDNFVSVVRERVAENKRQDPNRSRWFLVSDELAAVEDLDDETKDRLIAASVAIHELGHAWHERSTKQIGQEGEEVDPIDYVASVTRTRPEDFEPYMQEAMKKSVKGSGFPNRPDVTGLPEAEKSRLLAEYNSVRKKLISEAFKDALNRFLNDSTVGSPRSLSSYRDDGLSKKEIAELTSSSTVSEYGGSSFAEAIAESFLAEYLGMTYAKSLHQDKIWNYMNQVKTAESVTTEQLPGGAVIETDENGNIFVVDEVCGGLDEVT
jgi:hypothetical protein